MIVVSPKEGKHATIKNILNDIHTSIITRRPHSQKPIGLRDFPASLS
jgi:hypothetical protein